MVYGRLTLTVLSVELQGRVSNRSWLTSTIPDVQLRAKLAVEEREAGVSLTGMVEMKISRGHLYVSQSDFRLFKQ